MTPARQIEDQIEQPRARRARDQLLDARPDARQRARLGKEGKQNRGPHGGEIEVTGPRQTPAFSPHSDSRSAADRRKRWRGGAKRSDCIARVSRT